LRELTMKKLSLPLVALLLCNGAAQAHEGLGLLAGSHGHPSDALALLSAAAVVAFGWWLARKD
jgi:hypothetical protein